LHGGTHNAQRRYRQGQLNYFILQKSCACTRKGGRVSHEREVGGPVGCREFELESGPPERRRKGLSHRAPEFMQPFASAVEVRWASSAARQRAPNWQLGRRQTPARARPEVRGCTHLRSAPSPSKLARRTNRSPPLVPAPTRIGGRPGVCRDRLAPPR